MIDWGSVPAWVGAGAAVVGFAWTLLLAFQALERERSKLANSVICYIETDRNVVVRNLSESLVTEVYVRAVDQRGDTTHVSLGQTFILPKDSLRAPLPQGTPAGVSLSYGFMDARGDSWERRWGEPAKRLNGLVAKIRR